MGLSAHGQLIKGTGLLVTIIYNYPVCIDYYCLETVLCDSNSIKKGSRYIPSFSLHLYGLLIAAFENSSYCKNNYYEWFIEMKGNTSFKYWYRVLDLEKDIILIVRSLRQSNLLRFYLLFRTLLLFSSH